VKYPGKPEYNPCNIQVKRVNYLSRQRVFAFSKRHEKKCGREKIGARQG